MREIKFRVWEKYLKEMIPVHSINFKNKMINTETAWRLFDEVVLMQFTGLHDKNGKEIYVGDVVQGRSRMDEDWILKQEVIYLNGCYMFGNWNAHEYFNKHTDIEVVGNIYENPELLTK